MSGRHLDAPDLRHPRRILWAFTAAWTAVILLSLGGTVYDKQRVTKAIALAQARIAYEKDILYRRWAAGAGGVYVEESDAIPANPYLAGVVAERDVTTPSGRRLTLVNPGYMTRMVHDLGATESGVLSHMTSLAPIRPNNQPDPWEREALLAFQAGGKEVSGVAEIDGRPYMRLMQPLVTEARCIPCHTQQGYRVGEVRGGISVSTPMAPLDALFRRHMGTVAGGYLAIWLLGLAGLRLGGSRIERELTQRWRAEQALLQEKAEQAALIRKLEEAHNQLLHSEKMASIGQLAAGVAHEINNPVGYVMSNLGTLKEYVERLLDEHDREAAASTSGREGGPVAANDGGCDIACIREDIGPLLAESRAGMERVRDIVADLREFASTHERAFRTEDLHSGLDGTLNIVRSELTRKADVVRQYGDLPPIDCVMSQLNQVFLNILMNAAQSIDGHGTITVCTGMEGTDRVFVAIGDDGGGMTPEQSSRIFEPFFTTKAIGEGTGLGLSVAYGIVRKHNGHIEVYSEPGKGSTFRIVLPVRQPAAAGIVA